MEQNLATVARETRSSVELTRNAKGDYQWVIKKYYEEGEEMDILEMIFKIDTTLRESYLS